jgi:hypothetical protein
MKTDEEIQAARERREERRQKNIKLKYEKVKLKPADFVKTVRNFWC